MFRTHVKAYAKAYARVHPDPTGSKTLLRSNVDGGLVSHYVKKLEVLKEYQSKGGDLLPRIVKVHIHVLLLPYMDI